VLDIAIGTCVFERLDDRLSFDRLGGRNPAAEPDHGHSRQRNP
jgi:hypothetical protein